MKRGAMLVAGAALACVATPALAGDVASFLARARPMLARPKWKLIFSKEARDLQAEAKQAAAAFKAEKDARARAGRPPLSCPPPGARMGHVEFMRRLAAIPPAERGMSLKDGMIRVSRDAYPCR